MILIVPTLGALAGGILLHYFFPDSRGSGIPQVKVAYSIRGGRIPLRVVLGKFVTSVVQIGSGSSLGREGPTVQICAGIASQLGQWFALSRKSLASLLPVGAAAGIAAAFNAPISAVTFAIEEIVGDIDQTILGGVVVAAAVAAAIERGILGAHPVLESTVEFSGQPFLSLFMYLPLGVAAAMVSVGFTDGLLGVRRRFQHMEKLPSWLRPALGGLATGSLAVIALRALGQRGVAGIGYETLSLALAGRLAVSTLIALLIMKVAATVLSYGSGGAGGIFAPALFMGAMLGGAVGHLDVTLLHHSQTQVAAFALVGMGAVFAGVIRAPITSVLIIFEMTDGYALILPLMVANMTAYGLSRRWRPRPIYEALLEQDGIHLPYRATGLGQAIENLDVGSAMTSNLVCIASDWTVSEATEHIAIYDFPAFPVVDPEGRFEGMMGNARLRRAMARDQGSLRIGDLVEGGETIGPDQPLVHAVVRMNGLGVRELAVVEEKNARLVGLLTMGDVVRAQADAAIAVDASLAPDFGEAPTVLRKRD